MTVLQAEGIHKSFGSLEVLKGIDLEVQAGETIVIIGSSGSGKSTFLRCLNFLEEPTKGSVTLQGRTIGRDLGDGRRKYSEKEFCDVRARVGMCFQQFNLFPHMNVLRNVMQGQLTVLKRSNEEAEKVAREQLANVGLAEKADAFPSQLSGGQMQRVAIARALAMGPEVLLFDEPTSALDPELVGEVLQTIRALSEQGKTMLIVTHEIGFAYHVADRILFLHKGKIHEQGPPKEVLVNPQMPRTQEFMRGHTQFAIPEGA